MHQRYSYALFYLFIFSEKNPVYRESNSRPNVSEGYEVISEPPGRPAQMHQRYSYALFYLFMFSEKNPVYRDSNSRPNVSEGYEVIFEATGATGTNAPAVLLRILLVRRSLLQ